MFKYKITYDKTAFVSGPKGSKLEPGLNASTIKRLNRKFKESLPKPFLELVQAAVSLDDHQDGSEKKAFVSIVVMAELVSESVGWFAEHPEALFTEVCDALKALTKASISLEDDWEILSVDEV